jgi:hypothetical protein
MRSFIILALVSLAAAQGGYPTPAAPAYPATPVPAEPAPAPAYPATPAPAYPDTPAPAYPSGEHHEGYGDEYGNHKFYAPSLGDRIRAKLHRAGRAIERGVHKVGAFFKDKWLTFKSDMERIHYWGHCKAEKFRKYWKLKREYEAGKRRELTRLEAEKLAFFNKWVAEHKADYEKRKHECGGRPNYDYDSDPNHH